MFEIGITYLKYDLQYDWQVIFSYPYTVGYSDCCFLNHFLNTNLLKY